MKHKKNWLKWGLVFGSVNFVYSLVTIPLFYRPWWCELNDLCQWSWSAVNIHNQFIAFAVLEIFDTPNVFYFWPIVVSAFVTGFIFGVIVEYVYRKLRKRRKN
jgi:hypothetical protein